MSLLLGLNARSTGKVPTGTVSTTLLEELSIAETLSDCWLATYISLLDGLKASPTGVSPSLTESTTVLAERAKAKAKSEK